MKASTSRLSRRNFLFAASASGIAAAAVVAGKARTQGQAKKPEAAAGGKGYQLTEHVRKYYDTTKV